MLDLGFEPIEIVPAVLCSEAITGILAGVFHHGFGNVDLRRGSHDLKIAMVLIGFSIVGVLLATIITIYIPGWAIKIYIGVLILALGLVILLNKKILFLGKGSQA